MLCVNTNKLLKQFEWLANQTGSQSEAKTTRHRHLFACIPEPVHEPARVLVCVYVYLLVSVCACLVTAARVCMQEHAKQFSYFLNIALNNKQFVRLRCSCNF